MRATIFWLCPVCHYVVQQTTIEGEITHDTRTLPDPCEKCRRTAVRKPPG